jgi:hypothetical protein
LVDWESNPRGLPATISLLNKYDWIKEMQSKGYKIYITRLGQVSYYYQGIPVFEDFGLDVAKDPLAKRPIQATDCKEKNYGNYYFINRFDKEVRIQIAGYKLPGYGVNVFTDFKLAPGDQKCEFGLAPGKHFIYYTHSINDKPQKQTQVVVVEQCFEKILEIK